VSLKTNSISARLVAFILITFFCAGLTIQLTAQSVVVSSYFNAASPDSEWSELLVIDDNLDLRNYTYRDNNSTQNSWMQEINFRNIDFWSNMRAGTVIIIWHRTPNPLDVNKVDGYIQVAANDPAYFTGGNFPSNTLNIAAPGDVLQIRNPEGVHVHALGHIASPGPSFTALPSPKLNHTAALSDGEAVMVSPGTNLNEYGTNGPQSGNTWTIKSTSTTFGLPNNSGSNSAYWRSLRQPLWITPTLSGTLNPGNTEISLTWNAATDPNPADQTQGYIILRNTVNSFTDPVDGTTYTAGQMIGSATVVAIITSSGTTTYTDVLTIPCNEDRFYRVYAYRYNTDNLQGNSFNVARGRAYNESFAGTTVAGPDDQVVIVNITPSNADICLGQNAVFNTTNNGTGSLLYQWQLDSGSGWSDLTEAAPYSGTNTAVLTISSPPLIFNGYQYRCRVTPACGSPAFSPAGTLLITAAPTAPTSASATPNIVCVDDAGNITLTANGGSGSVLQWFTGSCGGTLIGTGNNLVIPSPTITTTYYARWSTTNCGFSGCAQVTVTVSPLPTPSNAGANSETCGLSTNLQGNNPDVGTGIWSFVSGPGTAIFSNVNLYNTLVTVTTSGTYVFRWTISTGGSCPDSQDEVQINFVPEPTTSNAGPNQFICATFTTNMAANTPLVGTGQWSQVSGPAGFVISEPGNPLTLVTASQYGTYVLRWTISNGICPASTDDVQLTISEAVAVLASSNSPVCELNDLELYADIGGATYSWTGPNGFTSTEQNPVITAATPANSGLYEVIVSNIPGGCPTTSNTTLASVNAAPETGPITPANGEFCTGTSVSYSVTGETGSTYTWTVTGGTVQPPGNTATVQIDWGAVPGTYLIEVIQQNIAGCLAEVVATNATLTEAPEAYAGNDDGICEGDVYPLNNAVATGDVLAWSTSGDGAFSDPAIQNPVYTPGSIDAANGFVTLTLTASSNAAGCDPDVSSMELSIDNSLPLNVVIDNPTNPVCTAEEITLSLIVTNGGSNPAYAWYLNSIEVSNADTYTFTPVPGDEVYCIVSSSLLCATNSPMQSDLAVINFSPQILVNDINVTNADCGVDNGIIEIIASGGTPPLQFSIDGGGIFQALNVFSDLGAMNYQVVVRDNAGCVFPYGNVSVGSEGGAVVDLVDIDDALCNGSTGIITIFASGGTPPLQYSINGGDDWSNGSVFSGLPPGPYEVSVMDAFGCITNYGTATVGNTPGPALVSVIPQDAVDGQFNGEVEINVSGNGPFEYSLDGTNYQTSNTFFNLQPGSYGAFVRDINGCILNVPFTIGNTNSIQVIVEAADAVACLGEKLTISVNASGFNELVSFSLALNFDPLQLNYVNYLMLNSSLQPGSFSVTQPQSDLLFIQWSFNQGVSLSDGTLLFNLEFTTLTVGSGQLEWESSQSGFVSGAGTPVSVTYNGSVYDVNSKPQLSSTGGGSFCEGSSISLQGSSPDQPNPALIWLRPDGSSFNGAVLDMDEIGPDESGVYTLIATNSDGCRSESTQSVNIEPLPQIMLAQEDTLCAGSDILLDAGPGYAWYVWSDGTTNQTLTVNETGEYSVEVSSALGCIGSDTVWLRPCNFRLLLPNAFTPDADGLNDGFGPVWGEILPVEFKLMVFNSWGQLIYESSDFTKKWDGRFNGERVKAGVYAYIMHVSMPDYVTNRVESPVRGTVTVIW